MKEKTVVRLCSDWDWGHFVKLDRYAVTKKLANGLIHLKIQWGECPNSYARSMRLIHFQEMSLINRTEPEAVALLRRNWHLRFFKYRARFYQPQQLSAPLEFRHKLIGHEKLTRCLWFSCLYFFPKLVILWSLSFYIDSNGQLKELVFPKALDLDRPKRARTTFSPEQLYTLEREFHKNQYLVGRERTELSQRLRLSETQVRIFTSRFQNRMISATVQ